MHTCSKIPNEINYFRCSLLTRSRDERIFNQLGGIAVRGINIQKEVQFVGGNILHVFIPIVIYIFVE